MPSLSLLVVIAIAKNISHCYISMHHIYFGCVWLEDEVGWDMTIHQYWDKDIHDACLVG